MNRKPLAAEIVAGNVVGFANEPKSNNPRPKGGFDR